MKYLFLLLLTTNAFALSEKEHQDQFCTGKQEVVIKGGRIDCLTDKYAIELGFASHWKTDLSQARWYALQTGKIPAYAIIFKKPTDIRYLEYLEEYMAGYGVYIKIFILKDY